MRKALVLNIAVVLTLLAISVPPIYAHPGRLNKQGCHVCRTRCTYWGVKWYKIHCHRR